MPDIRQVGLTQDRLDFYNKNGYLVIKDLLKEEETNELNERAASMVNGNVALYGENQVFMEPEAIEKGLVSEAAPKLEYLFKIGHQMHMTDCVFRYYAMHERLLDILNDLIGEDIKCIQSMYIDKPQNLGVGQPYHQDSFYIKTEPNSLMGVWIACDDVDEANGCLHVVPGSHRDSLYSHDVPVDPKQRKMFLEVHEARNQKEISCQIKKGDAVIFPGTLLHRSGDNVTADRQRRACVFHYGNARSKWLNDPSARNPHLLVRGRQYSGCL